MDTRRRMEATRMYDRQIARLMASMEAAKSDEQGQGLVEYALILVLVALACIGTLGILGTSLNDAIDSVVGVFP